MKLIQNSTSDLKARLKKAAKLSRDRRRLAYSTELKDDDKIDIDYKELSAE